MMAEQGIKELSLPVLGKEPLFWIPIGLIAARHPSSVRVTRKGVPKHDGKYKTTRSVWRATTVSPPEHWFK